MNHWKSWAKSEFGDASLGDWRRTARLIEVAGGVCQRPAGRVTQVFSGSAAREGAFRFLENEEVDAMEVARASHRSTARRCANRAMVLVATDATTLSFTDLNHCKFGPTGNREGGVKRGMIAMSGLAVDGNGTTLGPLGLEYWVRPQQRSPKRKKDKRPAEQRESRLWRRVIEQTCDVLQTHAPECVPWFQLDRGGDFGDVLELAQTRNLCITVRAAYNRAIEGKTKQYLWNRMRREPVVARLTVAVPARGNQPARIAPLCVRSRKMRFRVAEAAKQRRTQWVEMTAVYVAESSRGPNRIEWMLWTTYPVTAPCDALRVVKSYTARWRVEEFHRAWKSSHCDIESSQLRSIGAIQRWGAITAAVAARAEHLKLRSRAEPDVIAETELSRHEIDAAILLSETKKHRRGDPLTLKQAIDLIAQVGGYTGKSSGGPPGTITISRGLDRVLTAAKVLALVRSG